MKITKELRDLSEQEQEKRLEEFKKELLKLNAQVASGSSIPNPGALRNTKKNIARIKTLQNEKKRGIHQK